VARLLECRSPSVAVGDGEDGSGGALAATVTDRVLVTTSGCFAALAPEGAAIALHTTPQEAADQGAVTPAQLCRLGFADELISDHATEVRIAVGTSLLFLGEQQREVRLAARRARWSRPLPGRCRSTSRVVSHREPSQATVQRPLPHQAHRDPGAGVRDRLTGAVRAICTPVGVL